ncbi:MAG: FMN-binding protein [Treponema sp.]|nr:FMN-binding protein [Treponema sp.]
MQIRAILCFFAAVALGFSCSAAKESLHDGYYNAEAAEFDDSGWKEYITICVSGGQIISVEYDAFNASGFIRSWCMDYMRTMKAVRRTYPNAYARYYGGKFLSQQNTDDISHLSGATRSHRKFLQLAEAVLDNARQGDNETIFVRF